MKRIDQRGAISVAVIVAVTMSLLFVGAASFGTWAYTGKKDFQTNTNQKIDAAVEVAKKQTETAKDNEFAEAIKSPVKSFASSATLGTVNFDYPKTYSAYELDSDSGGVSIDGYFHPNVVPGNDDSISFGLRFQIVSSSYAQVLATFDTSVKSGKVTISAFRAAKVPSTMGVRVDGAITSGKQGSMILLPLRDKTIKIWTESNDFIADFNKYTVPSISFIP